MQRMLDRRGVDDAEMDGVVLRERELFVIRPSLAVERQRRFEGSRLRDRIKPLRDQPDTLLGRRRRGAGGIDDDRTGELRIEPGSVDEIRGAGEACPIEIVAGAIQLEGDLARCSHGETHRILRLGERTPESVKRYYRIRTVVHR